MAQKPLKLLLTGGGTGGHVYPALATLDALSRYVAPEVLYVGTKRGIEARLVAKRGLPYRAIWIAGFQRSITLKNLLFPIKLAVSLWQSWRILRQFRPDVAVGTGGYVTGPILWLAAQLGIPVVIEEQDVHPGVTSRLLAPHARKICLAFEGAAPHFQKMAEKIVVTGNPVRADLTSVSREAARRLWNIPENSRVVLVFGGSQGAQAINDAVLQSYPTWTAQGMVILWQTGERDYERIKAAIGEGTENVRVFSYIDEMPAAYAAADVVVCRAGAITLAELAVVQKPAVLIPYPFAAGDHQMKNARFVESRGAAIVLPQREDLALKLQETVMQLMEDDQKRQKMQQAWKPLAHPDAADKIARVILDVAGVPVDTLQPVMEQQTENS